MISMRYSLHITANFIYLKINFESNNQQDAKAYIAFYNHTQHKSYRKSFYWHIGMYHATRGETGNQDRHMICVKVPKWFLKLPKYPSQ